MSARDVIAGEMPGCRTDFSYEISDAILSALTSAGYRILAPGEMDRETLEAAKKAKCDGCAQEIPLNKCGFHQNGTVTTPCHSAAIRALGGGEG